MYAEDGWAVCDVVQVGMAVGIGPCFSGLEGDTVKHFSSWKTCAIEPGTGFTTQPGVSD